MFSLLNVFPHLTNLTIIYMLRQVSDNFYILTRKGQRWTPEEFQSLKQYTLRDIFHPVPKDFVDDAITGSYFEEECLVKPCKMVMLNFDVKNGKKYSLRGIVGVDFKIDTKGKSYILVRVIGCKSITNTPAATAKKKSNVIMKTGRDMLLWWQAFTIKGNFEYIKLNGMEDVLGFYWKLGWRFIRHSNAQHALSEDQWAVRIDKLNAINKLRGYDPCWIEKERSLLLDKYFDRFLEGYYSDSKLRTYTSRDDLYDIYRLTGTRRRHHLGLRYHGYTMHWFPKEN